MKTIAALISIIVMWQGVSAQNFYGGDWNGGPFLESGVGTGIEDARIYDNVLSPATDAVDYVFACYVLDGPVPSQLFFDFRHSVSAGDGGTAIATGVAEITEAAATGRTSFGNIEWYFRAEVPRIILEGNVMHWFSIAPANTNTGHYYSTTTEGQNGIGEPLGDGNSFYDSTTLGADFDPTDEWLGAGTWDFSQGYGNHVIPEPATVIALAFGAALLLLRRTGGPNEG